MRWLLVAAALVVGVGAALAAGGGLAPTRSAPLETFQRTGDPRKIVVHVVVGLDDELAGSSTVEDARTVAVTVRVRPPAGRLFGPPVFRSLVGISLPVVVGLRDPIGDRTVVDAASGRAVAEAGIFQIPREPPVDLAEIGTVERGSFRSGDGVDFRWREFTGKTRALSDFRGRTVVIVSRTSFSGESKMSVQAVEEFLRTAAPEARARVVVLVATLAEDPLRAMIIRPSPSTFPLLVPSDYVGADAPEIFRLSAVPVVWFVGPDGAVREHISGVPASPDDIARGVAAAR